MASCYEPGEFHEFIDKYLTYFPYQNWYIQINEHI